MRSYMLAAALLLAGCSPKHEPAAYGNFEATEVIVSSEASGRLQAFTASEGSALKAGEIVATVDTVQLSLERSQVIAQRQATEARAAAATGQVGVFTAQRDVAKRAYDRQRRLFGQQATTVQQLDQAERDYRTVLAQIVAARAQRLSIDREATSSTARVEQIRDRIARSRVSNPVAGTVLTTYVHSGEVVQAGQPLYRIAKLDTLTLRAYITEPQLGAFKLGQRVTVSVDHGGSLAPVGGVVTWVSPKAEFTPTPVQTREERADLVYAIKVRVPNPRGTLKIGMPADLRLASAGAGS